jgi:hypothetical protein
VLVNREGGRIAIHDLGVLRVQGPHETNLQTLRILTFTKNLPALSQAIRLNHDGKTSVIPFSAISEIMRFRSRPGKLTGLIVGAIFDIVTVIMFRKGF